MKRIVCLMVTFCLLLLCGCQNNSNDSYTKPAYFYFPRSDISIDDQTEVIVQEVRDGSELKSIEELLQVYLEGPKDNDLYSPFPTEGTILDCKVTGDRIYLSLSKHYNHMTGLQLTLATSCLTLTLLDCISGSTTVEIHISADDGTVARSYTLTRDNIILGDHYVALPEE